MPTKSLIVPRHEPEVIRATADRLWGGDAAKVPTTTLHDVTVNGIALTSRYAKAHEIEALAALATALPGDVAPHVSELFCDSQATWCFQATLARWDVTLATAVARALERACIAHADGHNGIYVIPERGNPAAECVELGSYWAGARG